MNRYALVDLSTNTIIQINQFLQQPADPTHVKWTWVPLTKDNPMIDPLTQEITGSHFEIGGSPLTVTEVDDVRTLSQEETDALKDKHLADIDMVALRIAFNHENRIRVLEGKAVITLAQFKTAVRQLL